MSALSQPPKSTAPAAVYIHPSARLLKPFYWAAAIIAGVIFFYNNNNPGANIEWLLLLPAAIVVWTLFKHLRLRMTKLTVSPGKLRYETGMFSRSVRTMELVKVQDVRVDQSLMDRVLGLGTIHVETAGETGRLSMAGVAQPQEVADYILEAVRK
jgi:membrane protein YdbS with pleckstrin-like domain